jgi:hypothetical protein
VEYLASKFGDTDKFGDKAACEVSFSFQQHPEELVHQDESDGPGSGAPGTLDTLPCGSGLQSGTASRTGGQGGGCIPSNATPHSDNDAPEERAGECVLGGSREFVGFETAVSPDLPRRILEHALRYLPALAELEWGAPEPAFRPWTPDGQPRIGACEVPNLYLACGHEGDGITLAAATAERIAGMLVGA